MALRTLPKMMFLWFLQLLLLPPMIAFGQASMSSSGSGSWGDPTSISNFPDILVSGGGVNAWHNLNFAATSVSSDNGVTYAVDSSCNGYLYNDGKRTFTKHTEWGCVAQLHQGGDGNLYAIHRHTSGGYYLGRWNTGNSSWTDLSCCFLSFAVGNGSPVMVAHDANGTIWVSTNYGTTFATKPFCNAISESVDGTDAAGNPSFEVVCSNDTFVRYTNSTWGNLPGNGVLIANGLSGMYMVGTLGKANHYNGTSWDAIVSNTPITSLAVGYGLIFGVTSGNAYALSDTGTELTRNYSGTVGCNPNVPPSLCNTFHHTSQAQICIKEHCGAVVTGTPFNGNGQWGLTAKVHINDILNCFDASQDCVPYEPTDSTNMECSGGGTNTDSPETIHESFYDFSWVSFGGYSGPTLSGSPQIGDWQGKVKSNVQNACPAGTVSTCPVSSPVTAWFSCVFSDSSGEEGDLCYGRVSLGMQDAIEGKPSPWSVITPYVMRNGVPVCFAPGPFIAYRGEAELMPPCD